MYRTIILLLLNIYITEARQLLGTVGLIRSSNLHYGSHWQNSLSLHWCEVKSIKRRGKIQQGWGWNPNLCELVSSWCRPLQLPLKATQWPNLEVPITVYSARLPLLEEKLRRSWTTESCGSSPLWREQVEKSTVPWGSTKKIINPRTTFITQIFRLDWQILKLFIEKIPAKGAFPKDRLK